MNPRSSTHKTAMTHFIEVLLNGSAFNGRPGTEPRSNHKDRFARPVRCSAWLDGQCVMLFPEYPPALKADNRRGWYLK